MITQTPCEEYPLENGHSLFVAESSRIHKQYVFIDDNFAVYQTSYLQHPASYYSSPDWQNCTISSLVVPLYPKIYLEAHEAKKFFELYLQELAEGIDEFPEELVTRFFLASPRSFKDAIAQSKTIDKDSQSIILSSCMPKFIWVGEICTKPSLIEKKAIGLVIIDATEATISYKNTVIFASFEQKIRTLDRQNRIIELEGQGNMFDIYDRNLGGYISD